MLPSVFKRDLGDLHIYISFTSHLYFMLQGGGGFKSLFKDALKVNTGRGGGARQEGEDEANCC